MTALETIALSTPIVAHRIGGLVNLLEGDCGGILVSDHQPAAYAASISRALNSELSVLISQGQHKLKERYSAQINADGVLASYKKLVTAT